MAEIIDNGIANSSLPIILKMGALMLVVASVSMYCGVMASKHASFAAQGLGANLRRAEFEKLSTFSFGDIDRFSSASLITRLTNDVTNIQNMVAMALRLLVRSGVMVVASLVALYIRWQLAIILLIIVPIVALVLAIPDEGVYGPVPGHAAPAGPAQRDRPGKPGGHPGGKILRPGGV